MDSHKKNWNEQNYSYSEVSDDIVVLTKNNGRQSVRDPIDQLNNYRDEINQIYCPSLIPNKKNIRIFTAGLIFPKWSRSKIECVFTKDYQLKTLFLLGKLPKTKDFVFHLADNLKSF